MSVCKWMDKENVIHTHTHAHTHRGILFSHKKEWNLAICKGMDGAREYNAKQNKRKKNTVWFHSDVKFKKENKQAKEKRKRERQTKKQTLNYREQTDGYQRGGGWGDGWNRWWGLRRARIAWSTGCYMQTMNHGTLHQKLMMYCMVTNITLKKKK